MQLAITGANGFLGTHLVSTALENGHQVVALVRNKSKVNFPKSDSLSIEQVDYSRFEEEFKILAKTYGVFDAFIHNAAVTVSISKKEYFKTNTDLTKTILDAITGNEWLGPDGKFVYISSYAANGPLNGDGPVSNYGYSKLKSEHLIQDSGLSYWIIRPTAIYGPGDRAFLPLFRSAKKGLYIIPRSEQKLSMIHVDDLVYSIINNFEDYEGAWHFSDGNTYSHQNFVRTLQEVTGTKIRAVRLPIWLLKSILYVLIFFQKVFRVKPKLTVEKVQEITQDWNLMEDKNLNHFKFDPKYQLKNGFEKTYSYYQKNSMI